MSITNRSSHSRFADCVLGRVANNEARATRVFSTVTIVAATLVVAIAVVVGLRATYLTNMLQRLKWPEQVLNHQTPSLKSNGRPPDASTITALVHQCVPGLDDASLWSILHSPFPESEIPQTMTLTAEWDLGPARSIQYVLQTLPDPIQEFYEVIRGLDCAQTPVLDTAFMPTQETQSSINKAWKASKKVVLLLNRGLDACSRLDASLAAQQQKVKPLSSITQLQALSLKLDQMWLFKIFMGNQREQILEPRAKQEKHLKDIASVRTQVQRYKQWLEDREDALLPLMGKLTRHM